MSKIRNDYSLMMTLIDSNFWSIEIEEVDVRFQLLNVESCVWTYL